MNDNENPAPLHRAFRWMFQDRETKQIVIAQWPNFLLWAFLCAWLVGRLVHPSGTIGYLVSSTATITLMMWAADEIIRGVCPWRRILGAAALVGAFFV